MDTTSTLIKSVSRRVWAAPQRPFRVCSYDRSVRKGLTAGTLEELREKVSQVLLLSSLFAVVCEEDGTEVDSEEFLKALPDNTVFMVLEPGQNWSHHSEKAPQRHTVAKPSDIKPRTGRDIARVTFDLYRLNPKDVFGSLNVKATFQGLYTVSADFQCLGPKKVLREALRVASNFLQAAGHMLILCASTIKRIIAADLWQSQAIRHEEYWD
ncbi:lipid transferase CIDEB isoform X2 [Denticeps clupeoides]|uniref:CIDE-N domain-containing protein n=1 Tax=Denticeps clupeoides TaxID=299321 RepID=A0AAY4BSZ9_9TELE|nr:cell death activator CIDE-B isoform X2 [Denticeps clupeoides]